MADCELVKVCIFFNDKMEGYPIAARRMKAEYCQGDNSECARYIVFRALGRDAVPRNLFPSQLDRVGKIIESARGT